MRGSHAHRGGSVLTAGCARFPLREQAPLTEAHAYRQRPAGGDGSSDANSGGGVFRSREPARSPGAIPVSSAYPVWERLCATISIGTASRMRTQHGHTSH